MARTCLICENQMNHFVREKFMEYPSQPNAVIRAIKVKYDIDVTYWMLRNHRKMHDPVSGTYVQAKRTVTKNQLQLEENLNKSSKILNSLVNFVDKVTELEKDLDPEAFKALPFDKQVSTIAKVHTLTLQIKDREMKQQALDMEKDVTVEKYSRVAAHTFRKNKPVVVEVEEDADETE